MNISYNAGSFAWYVYSLGTGAGDLPEEHYYVAMICNGYYLLGMRIRDIWVPYSSINSEVFRSVIGGTGAIYWQFLPSVESIVIRRDTTEFSRRIII